LEQENQEHSDNQHHPTGEKQKPTLKVNRIEIRIHSHATEVERKVTETALKLLPEDIDYTAFTKETLLMSAGNALRIFTLKVTDKKTIEFILNALASMLRTEDKKYLNKTLENRIEYEKNIYIRLNKQYLCIDKAIVEEGSDVIQIRITIAMMGPVEDRIKIIREFLLEKNIIA
jgi:RNA binding exosome subunit